MGGEFFYVMGLNSKLCRADIFLYVYLNINHCRVEFILVNNEDGIDLTLPSIPVTQVGSAFLFEKKLMIIVIIRLCERHDY